MMGSDYSREADIPRSAEPAPARSTIASGRGAMAHPSAPAPALPDNAGTRPAHWDKYELANRLRKLFTLPPALKSACGLALAFRRGSTCGLDRVGGSAKLVRGDVRDGPAWPAA
jgi:hypothetical protein